MMRLFMFNASYGEQAQNFSSPLERGRVGQWNGRGVFFNNADNTPLHPSQESNSL
jgi:hypothetical protein